MYFLGQTLNVFTLGGLALAVGRLVDDSIVELENINRHLNIPGTPRRKAVLDAAREVAMPIFSATITTIIVFPPTVFLEGQTKLLFVPLTFTISVSLFASFLVSRTVTPLLALKLLKPEKPIDPGRGVCKDRVFRPVASAFFTGRKTCTRRSPSGPRPPQVRAGLHRRRVRGEHVPRGGALPRPQAAHRHRVLPAVGRGPVPRGPEGARRHARGGDGADGEGRRGDHPANRWPRRAAVDRVQRRAFRPGSRPCSRSNTGPHSGSVQVYLDGGGQAEAQRPRDRRRAPPALRRRVPGIDATASYRAGSSRACSTSAPTPRSTSRSSATTSRPRRGVAARSRGSWRRRGRDRRPRSAATRNYPQFEIIVDREKAATAGLSQRDVAQAALFSLNSNASINPSMFTDPRTGNQYNIVVQLDEPYPRRRRRTSGGSSSPPTRPARCSSPPRRHRDSRRARSRSSGSTSSG